ncbi:unnamed protein product [Trypanosoma congolense IL3000]|uniref:WGS project CAEQ00000000 data, annotated contig 1741 n=1 Tax=Trypanosoma congolense (strain IL3000) TaxID=1068625 RepID=F9W8K6_TRYCI|nr:unnamed protein product [Trypanosoma congolense IL3000]
MLGDKRSERPAAPPRRSRGLFALFCTVERDRFAIFASLFKRYRLLLDPFVERVVGPHLALYPNLVNMLEFLRNPSGAPGGCFFDYPLLAWPFNVLYTASCFYVTARLHGYHRLFSALSSRGGLLASGKDVLGALAVAMSPTEEALIRNTSVMYHAAFFAGSVYLENESCLESHVHKCTNRSFALLVVNITISSLKLLVDEVNQIRLSSSKASRSPGTEGVSNVIPLSHVEIARVLGNRCAIVSGNPIDLERLDVLLVRYAWTVGIKIRKEFLSIFTPENSFYYNQSRHLQLLQLWLDNGVELDASSLHLTLYSPVDGTPWSNGTMCNFMDLVARTVTYSPHDLSRSLRHLSSGDVLLDFTASDLCAGQLIELGDCSVTVLSEPGDVVVSTILSTPKRGSIKHVMESSFAKCAIINDILQSMHWEGKPPSARIDELSGTFVHFGLLARGSSTRRPFSSRQQSWHESRQRKHDRGPGHMFSAAVSPECCLALDEGPCHGAAEYVVVPNERIPAVVDLYQISPVIRNYEIQSGCVLTAAGVEFMRRLLLCTRLPFPPHTLLMCPSVLDLIYLWETYEFLRGRGVGDSG